MNSRACSPVSPTIGSSLPPCPSASLPPCLLASLPLSGRPLAHRAPLDALLVVRPLEDGVHVDARRVDEVRLELADFDQLFHLGNHRVGRRRHHRVEVARRLAVDEVPPAVPFPRLEESVLRPQRLLPHAHLATDLAGL